MWYPRKLTPAQLEERRLASACLLESGQMSQAQIARQLGVHRQSVSRWAHKFSAGGEQALYQRSRPGRKPRLNADQWQQTLQALEQGAQAAGFPTERWTLARVQKVISRRFGVRYNANYLSECLHRFGWSVQKPAVRARERNDALIEAWLTGDWPRIKKACQIGAHIAFVDEVGFSFLDKTATTWAPKGQTPTLRRVSKRRTLSTVVALTTNGRLLKRHFDHAVKGPDVIVALRHFRRYLSGPLIIIWDRLTAHRDRKVQLWIAADPDLYIEWLPPYAPDLNPEEACNASIKSRLRNATPENEKQLRHLVDRTIAQIRQRPDILKSFFQHAGMGDVTLFI